RTRTKCRRRRPRSPRHRRCDQAPDCSRPVSGGASLRRWRRGGAHRGHPVARAAARPEADSVLNILGIIPARGGSKAIPRKNLAPLGGRPLIAYTVEAARASSRLTRVIVSTDREDIASEGRTLGAEVPFLRPAD